MHLSQNFTLQEFTHSPTADRLKITNTPSPEAVANLRGLCEHVLQPLREALGRPIRITSGYRCKALNAAVGGAPQSQHQRGEAADFIVHGLDLDEVYEWMRMNIIFDQLIREPSWIHVSWTDGQNRREAWRQDA